MVVRAFRGSVGRFGSWQGRFCGFGVFRPKGFGTLDPASWAVVLIFPSGFMYSYSICTLGIK